MSDAALPPHSSASSAPDSPGQAAPWLWRLLTTPVSEVAAGRVTGWMKPQRAVAETSLPAPLSSLVLDVAKRSRLWRSEQTEIARELAAHFADGLHTGRSVEQLLTDFGDPAQAALLLRRAAKRNRPWPWQAMRFARRAALYSLLGLIVLYGAIAIRFYVGRPGAIIDYRPELNAAALAVKEDERAWPLYREALLRLPSPHVDVQLVGERRLNRMPHPGEEGWDVVEAYLQEATPALQFARQANGKPGLGLVVGYEWSKEDQALWPTEKYGNAPDVTSPESNGMVGILLPHLASLRKLGMTLGWDAEAAAAAGDGERALADVRAMFAIARHMRETPLIINDLVSIALLARACILIDSILAQKPELWSAEQLTRLAHSLAVLDDRAMAIDLSGERTGFKDVLQRIYTDDGSGDGRITARGIRWLRDASTGWIAPREEGDYEALFAVGGPALGTIVLGRRAMAQEYDRLSNVMQAEMATPLWERDESAVEQQLGQWLLSPIDRLRYFPLVAMMPALSKSSINAELAMMRRDATITAIALELYRRRHGSWPATLAELVPQIMPALPVDRFDGQPLRYRVVDGQPMLYSVGSDREDDGGVAPRAGSTYAQTWLPRAVAEERRQQPTRPGAEPTYWDGDWILGPPLPEEPLRQEEPPSNVSHWNGAP